MRAVGFPPLAKLDIRLERKPLKKSLLLDALQSTLLKDLRQAPLHQ